MEYVRNHSEEDLTNLWPQKSKNVQHGSQHYDQKRRETINCSTQQNVKTFDRSTCKWSKFKARVHTSHILNQFTVSKLICARHVENITITKLHTKHSRDIQQKQCKYSQLKWKQECSSMYKTLNLFAGNIFFIKCKQQSWYFFCSFFFNSISVNTEN